MALLEHDMLSTRECEKEGVYKLNHLLSLKLSSRSSFK